MTKRLLHVARSPYLAFLLRISLGALFVWASWDKIVDPGRFAEDVANYGILPPLWVNLCALTLPWLEMIAGLFLILGCFTRSSALILSVLLIVFLIAIAISLARGVEIDCGCFGAGEELTAMTLIRDLLFLAMGIQVFWFDQGFLSLPGLWRRRKFSKR
ncbi:MAG: MauE/DoxX family redox-associated membrane protein [candidate division NC10 bacterium]|nr:MauE/DoxX family redox-associated membrane protein [candidate division NC10 bacterium]